MADEETASFREASTKFQKLFNMPLEEKLVNCESNRQCIVERTAVFSPPISVVVEGFQTKIKRRNLRAKFHCYNTIIKCITLHLQLAKILNWNILKYIGQDSTIFICYRTQKMQCSRLS